MTSRMFDLFTVDVDFGRVFVVSGTGEVMVGGMERSGLGSDVDGVAL